MATPSIPAGYKLVPDDGTPTQTVIPEARGKAAAHDRWMAQGGKPSKVTGKFREGPMKGMTYDQAKQRFEGMWASSPDGLKEKYAGRSKSDLAPSERLIPGMTPPTLRIESPKINPAATRVGGASPASASPQPMDQRPERDVVIQGIETNASPATAIPQNNGQPQPTSALERQFPGIESGKPTGIPSAPMVPGQTPRERQFPGIEKPQPTAPRPAPAIQGLSPAPVTGTPSMIARPEVRSREMVPNALRRPDEATDGTPVVARPADVNGQRMDPAIPGAVGNKVRINSLTGLPFGYQPGDKLPDSANAAMQQRGRDSQTRQSVAAAGAPPPRAVVVGTPAPRPTALQQSQINRPRTVTTGVEARAGDEMRRQAAINANPGTVNPSGLRLVGPKRPLDELVKRQKLSGIGTPSRA